MRGKGMWYLDSARRMAFALCLAVTAMTGGLIAGIPVDAAAQENWVADPITGCQVWTPGTEDGEIVSWTGDCVDGKAAGPGVLVWVVGGELVARYSGTMVAGKVDGFGDLAFLRDDGYLRYNGAFRDGKLHGQGHAIGGDGASYQGDFANNLPHGEGLYEGADGSFYQGDFLNGKPHGVGTSVAADGAQYQGEFRDGLRAGTGTLTEADGNVYVGQFENDQPNGTGRWQLAAGGVYEGPVENGEAQGQGTFTAANGDVYVGSFVDNKPFGAFTVTKADGTTEQQIWRDGEQVE